MVTLAAGAGLAQATRPGAIPLPMPKPITLPPLPRPIPMPDLTLPARQHAAFQRQAANNAAAGAASSRSLNAWVQQNQLYLPNTTTVIGGGLPGAFPACLPGTYNGFPLRRVFYPTLWTAVGVYGTSASIPRYLAGVDTQTGLPRYLLDLQGLGGAQILGVQGFGNILYVSYLKPGLLHSGAVMAFDLTSGGILWNSPGQIANIESFAVLGNYLVTGWAGGSTNYLYILNRNTGAVVQREVLSGAPQYILPRGRSVYVRCRDGGEFRFNLR